MIAFLLVTIPSMFWLELTALHIRTDGIGLSGLSSEIWLFVWAISFSVYSLGVRTSKVQHRIPSGL